MPLGAGRALHHPELYLGNEDRIGLVGRNGAGKSTLLRALLRRVTLSEGVAHLPQEADDGEVRALLAELHGLSPVERGRVLSIVARLESPPSRVLDGEDLSPGEVRKLLIARSLLSSPHLIVMDEPTNHLDIRSIEALQDVLGECACALVLVSHDERIPRRARERALGIRGRTGERGSWAGGYVCARSSVGRRARFAPVFCANPVCRLNHYILLMLG